MEEIDRKPSSRWAIAPFLAAQGPYAGGHFFELVNLQTGRAHYLQLMGLAMGSPSLVVSGVFGCPSYVEFRTPWPMSFPDFESTSKSELRTATGIISLGAKLDVKSFAIHTWFDLTINLRRGPATAYEFRDVAVSMDAWNIPFLGFSRGGLSITITYGKGFPSCQSGIELVPPPPPPDEYERTNPIRIKAQEDKVCLDIMADVIFPFDRPKPNEVWDFKQLPAAELVLASAARIIRWFPERRVLINGHTDSIGPADYNQQLSERRAAAVAKWLTDPTKGKVKPQDVKTEGWGSQHPVVDNKDTSPTAANKKAQALNRRVEFCLLKR